MMNTQKHLNEIHEEIKTWMSQVALTEDEISVFKNQLGEVAIKNNSTEVRAQIEHFENVFLRQIEVTDQWKHDLRKIEHGLVEKAEGNPASNRVLVDDPMETRERAASYSKLFQELKESFREFLSKTL